MANRRQHLMLEDLYQCLRCFFFRSTIRCACGSSIFSSSSENMFLFFSHLLLTVHLNSNAYLFTHMNRWVSRNLLNFVLRQLSLLQFSCVLSGMFCNKSVFVGLVSYFVNSFSCLYFAPLLSIWPSICFHLTSTAPGSSPSRRSQTHPPTPGCHLFFASSLCIFGHAIGRILAYIKCVKLRRNRRHLFHLKEKQMFFK